MNAFYNAERMHQRYAKTNNVNIIGPKNFFDLIPAIVSCPPGQRLSQIGIDPADGGKWACGIEAMTAPCHVFSLGSNGNYAFEKDILARTPCTVDTFDCTMATRGGGTTLHPTRHQFFLKCLGSEEKAAQDPSFVSLRGAKKLAGAATIDLLKIDIEGFEYDVLGAPHTGTKDDLPLQILMEVHLQYLYLGTKSYRADNLDNLMWPLYNTVTAPELTLFFVHLANLGFAVAHEEKNPGCYHCSEFVLLRVE